MHIFLYDFSISLPFNGSLCRFRLKHACSLQCSTEYYERYVRAVQCAV